MGQSITTRFSHGERGAFITARTSGGIRKRFPYDHAAGADGSHLAAAWALAASLNWTGQWAGGALDDKGARVWVSVDRPSSERFDVK